MTPATRSVDRILCGLVGLLLIAAGGTAIAWHYRRLAPTVRAVATPDLHAIATAGWWPWALGAGAVVVVVVALRWLLGHFPRPVHAQTLLSGSGADGVLRLDVDTAGNSAAAVLAAHDVIGSAKATVRREHGHDVITITATAPPADLTAAAHLAADVHTQLASALQGTSVHARILLHLKNTRANRHRVR